MALLPSQLFDLTPGELSDCFQGWLWRQERELYHIAWQTAHIMNASGRYKERITIEQLLGFELKTLLRVDEVPVDAEALVAEKRAELAELKEHFADIIPPIEPPKPDKIDIEM